MKIQRPKPKTIKPHQHHNPKSALIRHCRKLVPTMESNKKHCKTSKDNGYSSDFEDEVLLPGLPNHLAQLCLASLPPPLLFSVCRSWRRFLYSPAAPPFFCLYALLSPSPNPQKSHNVQNPLNSIDFFSFDPLQSIWEPLPPPPTAEPPLNLVHRHPSFLSRKLPIQSLTVSNNLVLIAGSTHQFAPSLSNPLIFSPESNQWLFGPEFSIPRRWCVAGAVRDAIYVASGVGSSYRGDVARSMEQWDFKVGFGNWKWVPTAALKDGRFSREAVEAVGYRGKLYMVNVKGNAVKDGMVYDVERDRWEEMPRGMIAGWNGPAAAAVTVEEEEVLYVVDESVGRLSEYVREKDCWRKVIELEELEHAEQMVAGRGRVCVVCANGERVVVVDVEATPVKVWTVDPPPWKEVVAVHILPRRKL